MKIDDKRQLPFQVGKLTGLVHRLEQLLARLGDLIPASPKATSALIQPEAHPDPDAYPPDSISLKDAAKLLGVRPSFLSRLIKQGYLRSWKLPGGQKRVSRAAVLALPEACPSPSPSF